MKSVIGLVIGALIAIVLTIAVLAWMKGGNQPAQTMEVPTGASSDPAAGV